MIFKDSVIFLNNVCNFNCYHCYVKKGDKELPFPDLSFFIDNCINKYGIQRLTLVGGEPFLYNNFAGLLKKISDNKNLEIAITTNGSIYEDNVIELLKKNNVRLIKVSFYSLNPKVYDKFTGTTGQHKKVLENIDKFSKLFNVGINMTITKLNYKELDKMINFCRQKGIKFLHISQLSPSGNGLLIKEEELTREIVLDIKNHLNKYSDSDIKISYDDGSGCNFGKKLIINPDGDIYPCPVLISYPEYKIGNIYSSEEQITESLKKLNSRRTKKCFVEEFVSL